MATSQKVVIIGAGIVGCNVADELVARGWNNITVVEQGPLHLPGGSTSHAPGLVFKTSPSRTMTLFAIYTMEKFLSLEKDGQSCFNQVGGLEIATTVERLDELKRKQGLATSWGVQSNLVSPDECLKLYPHLNRELVLGGLHIPSDGLALAARATQLLIERTQNAGVCYLGSTPVTGIQKTGSRVTGVTIPNRTIPADIVVSCAGFWGVEVGAMAGITVPLLPLAHQYAKTTAVPAWMDRSCNNLINGKNAEFPILRYQDQDLYYREHGDQLGIGSYHHRPMPLSALSLGFTPKHVDEQNMPSSLTFTPQDFDEAWQLTRNLLPLVRDCDIAEGFNGIFSFTMDGAPLVGRACSLDNFHVAEAVWVTHSAGVAKALAQELTTGQSELDISRCQLSRFEDAQLAPAFTSTSGQQSFTEVYKILHPSRQTSNPRNIRVSPFYPHQKELKAVFHENAAWERPYTYETNARLLPSLPAEWQPVERDSWASMNYSSVAFVEAWRARTSVAIFDLTAFHRFEVSGPGAVHLLQRLAAKNVSGKPGTVTYTVFLTESGTVRADALVARISNDVFWVKGNSATDLAYLKREARQQENHGSNESIQVRDITGGMCSIGLFGPLARKVITRISTDDFSNEAFPLGTVRSGHIGGIPVTMLRNGDIGELGWEIVASAEYGFRLWELVWESGRMYNIIAAGRSAFDGLRLEKGQRTWGVDMTSEHDPFEVGVTHAIQLEKSDSYVGKEALIRRAKEKPCRRLRCLTIDDGRSIVLGSEPVYYDDKPVGYVTSAAFGYTIRRPIAYAWLPVSVDESDAVEIQYIGVRIKATVMAEPLFDPGSSLAETEDSFSPPAEMKPIQARL